MKTTIYELQIKSVMRRNYWATVSQGKKKPMEQDFKRITRECDWRTYRLVRVTTTREVIK